MSDSAAIQVRGRPLIPGEGSGPLLRLTHPISFWGGVDPTSGQIVDPRHPEFEFSITGTVLAIPAAVGSSSSSAIMLELLRKRIGPAAVLLLLPARGRRPPPSPVSSSGPLGGWRGSAESC